MDGSRVTAPATELEDVSNPVMTRMQVVSASDVPSASLAADCLLTLAHEAHPSGQIVERTGVHEENVTLRDGPGLYSCDDSAGPREAGRRWCAGAYGRLYRGHLHDPRLNIAGCQTEARKPLASAWVEPDSLARYVVVKQPEYAEVYEVAAELPVRVSTISGLSADPLAATFEVSEHDGDGKLLHRYRVEAMPAG